MLFPSNKIILDPNDVFGSFFDVFQTTISIANLMLTTEALVYSIKD